MERVPRGHLKARDKAVRERERQSNLGSLRGERDRRESESSGRLIKSERRDVANVYCKIFLNYVSADDISTSCEMFIWSNTTTIGPAAGGPEGIDFMQTLMPPGER